MEFIRSSGIFNHPASMSSPCAYFIGISHPILGRVLSIAHLVQLAFVVQVFFDVNFTVCAMVHDRTPTILVSWTVKAWVFAILLHTVLSYSDVIDSNKW